MRKDNSHEEEPKKEKKKPFSLKWDEEDKEKLEKIRKKWNLDSHAAVIRKLIRDFNLDK